MIRADFSWDDLGSWNALARFLPRHGDGNMMMGDVSALETSGSIITARGQRMAVLEAADLIVVATQDGVLVCPGRHSQEVKRLTREDA